ncbi:sensor histidine kinase [Rhodococcus xishaensis]|uniref:histidine kinase n=1 Tax=Rhodococcus xishaensis TaxID=2487364 RepID=A0A3S3AAR0_9NOCA|nr:sensor histidine kinase KdpD [Rhodococcus xishaensis]RVW05842.1 sensor histidine kinase KdpD [Rhodococcus xishaensis]
MSSPEPTRAPRRGELRIYIGAAPGVGKTYAMLGEAHRRIEKGDDVVAAVVETRDRARTAGKLSGLEVLEPRMVSYRGTSMPELDVEAVIARQPAVVLVDDLSHSNTPGSRNDKRWQDVYELLDAGIDVLSTLNVQHLESLSDVVQQITGVEQRETLPDKVVREATQVELVDLTPEALRRSLSRRNGYAADKVDTVLDDYFRHGNLTALRELALLWVAAHVDAELANYSAETETTETREARERVVVAVTGGPESETLVRRASRIASRSSAELMVVHVVRGEGLEGEAAADMGRVRKLAAGVGASLHNVVGDDVPTTLLEFAREVNATQLVIGTSRRSRWARIFEEGIGSEIVRRSRTIDVHIVTHDEAARRHRVSMPGRGRRILSWLAAVVVPSLAAALMAVIDQVTGLGAQNALFFVVVLGVALFGGVGPAILSALVSGLLLNYFFTDPLYSLTIAEPDNFVTTMVLMVVAVAVAVLVDAAAKRAREARRASQEAELLALFAGSVLRGADLPALLEKVRETYSQAGVSVVRRSEGVVSSVGASPPTSVDEAATVCEAGAGEYALLLAGAELGARDRKVLGAVANQAVGLIRQKQLAEEAGQASALAEADRLRRSLLSAVSHDLRTPLAAVKAAVSSLRSADIEFSPEDTAELLATVEESTDQLTALVGNLLDSSRLAAGVVKPTLRKVYLEEVVHRALVGAGPRRPGSARRVRDQVKVEVGDATVMADAGLLERVIANLVDNALRYAPDEPIRIGVARAGDRTTITVADTGPGLARGTHDQVFGAFQRLGDRDNTIGVGLGLSVVKGLVEAMGGTVSATDTPGGGLTMAVELAASPTGGTEEA